LNRKRAFSPFPISLLVAFTLNVNYAISLIARLYLYSFAFFGFFFAFDASRVYQRTRFAGTPMH